MHFQASLMSQQLQFNIQLRNQKIPILQMVAIYRGIFLQTTDI